MKRTVYCCDICGTQLKDYDPEVSGLVFQTTDTEKETRDICLHCIVTTLMIHMNVEGPILSQKMLDLFDKRAKEQI